MILQAGSELKPWIFKDDDHGRKTRRINRRIVKVIVELMKNNQENSQSLMIMATSSDLLLRASDGILVDDEACILPQLEVIEIPILPLWKIFQDFSSILIFTQKNGNSCWKQQLWQLHLFLKHMRSLDLQW